MIETEMAFMAGIVTGVIFTFAFYCVAIMSTLVTATAFIVGWACCRWTFMWVSNDKFGDVYVRRP